MKEEKSFFKLMKKVPGGLIIVPMLIGVLANTFIPNVLEIGGFTSGMFKTGTACLLGMFLLLNGASIDVKKIGMPLYKGCTLTLMKFVVGIVLGLLVAKIGGAAGFCGITSMAMIAGITNSAGGLYLGLAQQYGDETDAGAISILSLNDGPFFTMIAMGTAGMASIPIESFIATLIPLIIGIIWGNLDKTFRKVAADAMPIITFFMMIPIGAGMSLKSIALGGVGGVVLASQHCQHFYSTSCSSLHCQRTREMLWELQSVRQQQMQQVFRLLLQRLIRHGSQQQVRQQHSLQ